MFLTTLVFCNFLCGILCIILAVRQNRPAHVWFLLAIPFGILTVFTLLFLQENQAPENKDPQ